MSTKIFCLNEMEFVDEIPELTDRGYIIENFDKEVLELHTENATIELNNWEPYDKIVLEYFGVESENFMLHLDFFTEDNRNMIPIRVFDPNYNVGEYEEKDNWK